MPTAIWWDDPAVAARAVAAVPSDPGPQGASTAFLALHGMGKAVLRDLGSKGLVDGSVALDALKRMDVRGVDAAMAACGMEGSAASLLAQAAVDAAHRMDAWHAAGVPASAACLRAGLVFGVPQRLLSRFEPAARKQVIAPPVLDDLAGRAVMEQARRVFAQCPEPVGKGVVRRRLRYGSDGSVEESEEWDDSEHPRDQMGRFRTKPQEAQKQQAMQTLGEKAKRMLREKRAKRYERNTRQSLDSRKRIEELERAKKRTVKLKQQKQQAKSTVKEEQKKEKISRQKRLLSVKQQGFDLLSKEGHLDFRTMASARMLGKSDKLRDIGENGDWQPYIEAVMSGRTHNFYVNNGAEEYHVPDVVIKATGTAIALGVKPDELFEFLLEHRAVRESLDAIDSSRPMALESDYGLMAIQTWANANDMNGDQDAQTITFEVRDNVPIYGLNGFPAISQAQAAGMLLYPEMPTSGLFTVDAEIGDVSWSNLKDDHIVRQFLHWSDESSDSSGRNASRLSYDNENLIEAPLMHAIAGKNTMIPKDDFVERYLEFSARAHERGHDNLDVVLLSGYVNPRGEAVGYWPEFRQGQSGPGLEMTMVPSDKPVRIVDGEIAKSDSDDDWESDEHPRDVRGRFKYKSAPEQAQRVEERQVQDVSQRRAKRQRRAARMNQLNAQNRAQLAQVRQVQEQRKATLSRQEQAQAKQTLSQQKQTLSRQTRQISQKQDKPPAPVRAEMLSLSLASNSALGKRVPVIEFPKSGNDGWSSGSTVNLSEFVRNAIGMERGKEGEMGQKYSGISRALFYGLSSYPREVVTVDSSEDIYHSNVKEYERSPEGIYVSYSARDGLEGKYWPWAKAIRYDLIESIDGHVLQGSIYDDDQVNELFTRSIKPIVAAEISVDTVGDNYEWFASKYNAKAGDVRVVRSDEFFSIFEDVPISYGVVELPVGSKAGYTGPAPIELRFK